MASTILSFPQSQTPLPPSPPLSDTQNLSPPQWNNDADGVDTGERSPYTSSSCSTSASHDFAPRSPKPDMSKARVMSDSIIASHSSAPPRPPPKTGTVKLEDFELIRVLGKGCAGRVLLVRHTPTSSIQAMKAISKRSVLTHKELAHTIAELNILKRFAIDEPDNPFVARLHRSFTDRENFYFVMDFYPGGDLATQMEIHGKLGHIRMRFYATDMVQGLEDLHRQGIIVRDLKPENVLLNSRGHAVLADFGLSKEFAYRGDPKPLFVVQYPGDGELPEWAGKGAASVRTTLEGTKRLVVDRAYSFVGTSEYLAPEVVKRGEYSYAVDWWALGCIVLEGLIGRVPFRKEEEEPPIVLWNKILHDPWDELFQDPKYARLSLSDYGLDPSTWHFIDSLLMKDPMWRLTEPYVKRHSYFQYIDWETVRRGDYEDPYDLQLHPVSEYNTHYFPRLCLEQEPTVDMTDHEGAHYFDESHAQTSLNDNVTYMLEQARYKAELEGFTWSRDMEDGTYVVEPETYVEVKDEKEVSSLEETSANKDGIDPTVSFDIETPALLPPVRDETGELHEQPVVATAAGEPIAPTPDDLDATAKVDCPEAVHEKGYSSESSLLATPPAVSLSTVEEAAHISLPHPLEGELSTPPPTPPKKEHSIPIPMVKAVRNSDHLPSAPRPIPSSLKKAKPERKRSQDLTLPAGLPASGLSVSDLVSIPSPGLGSPSRIVRRHRVLPSVDTGYVSRLSVELNGTITQLGDDDWEQLDLTEGMQSIPNGRPGQHGFFNRVLTRRPSNLYSSGLRRQSKPSDTSSGGSNSPTKMKPPMTPASFGAISLGSTKRALEKIKAFPKLRKVSPNQNMTPPSSFAQPADESALVHKQAASSPSPPRPATLRRHTESGWFDKKRIKKLSLLQPEIPNPTIPKSVSARNVSTNMARSTSSEADPTTRSVSSGNLSSTVGRRESAPKLELTKTPPIVWELDGGSPV